jgi:hypothetical protein
MTEEIDRAGDGFEGAGIEEGDEKLLEKKISQHTLLDPKYDYSCLFLSQSSFLSSAFMV